VKLKDILNIEISVPKTRLIVFAVMAVLVFYVINLLFIAEPPKGNKSMVVILVQSIGKSLVNATDFSEDEEP